MKHVARDALILVFMLTIGLVTWAAAESAPAPSAYRPLLAVAKSNPFGAGLAPPTRPPSAPKPPKPIVQPVAIALPPPPAPMALVPIVPQLPSLQYIGLSIDAAGQKAVLLSYQNQAVWVRQGSTFDGQFELASIDSQNLVFKQVSSGELHLVKIPPLPAFETQ
jgi:hypothetical protein